METVFRRVLAPTKMFDEDGTLFVCSLNLLLHEVR